MSKDVRRILTVALLGPLLVAPLLVLEQVLGRPGLEWWRYPALAIGWAYLVPVLACLGGRWLVVKAARAGRTTRLAARALSGMAIISAVVVSYFLITEPSWADAARRISRMVRWEVFGMLAGVGLVYAIPDGRRLEAWVRERRRRRQG
ncbi:MAG: hypothetical protein R6U88_03450 [Candidatus Bipolaricaulota bacterium]